MSGPLVNLAPAAVCACGHRRIAHHHNEPHSCCQQVAREDVLGEIVGGTVECGCSRFVSAAEPADPQPGACDPGHIDQES